MWAGHSRQVKAGTSGRELPISLSSVVALHRDLEGTGIVVSTGTHRLEMDLLAYASNVQPIAHPWLAASWEESKPILVVSAEDAGWPENCGPRFAGSSSRRFRSNPTEWKQSTEKMAFRQSMDGTSVSDSASGLGVAGEREGREGARWLWSTAKPLPPPG
jgi:hypothetical protein